MNAQTMVMETKENFKELMEHVDELNEKDAGEFVAHYQQFMENVTPLLPQHLQPGFEEPTTHEFKRSLVGGILPHLTVTGYTIPESVVRQFGLEHGDKLIVHDEELIEDGVKHYNFEITEKANNSFNPRVEVDYCVVKRDFDKLYISHDVGGQLEGYEVEEPLEINPNDQKAFQLKDGDIVSIAFFDFRPQQIRVTAKEWKMETEQPSSKPAPRSAYKTKNSKPTIAIEERFPVDPEKFKGKVIGIIGGDDRQADYRNLFEELDCTVLYAQGTSKTRHLKNVVKGADAIHLVLDETSHNATELAINFAKKYDTAFHKDGSNGLQTVLLGAQKALEYAEDRNKTE